MRAMPQLARNVACLNQFPGHRTIRAQVRSRRPTGERGQVLTCAFKGHGSRSDPVPSFLCGHWPSPWWKSLSLKLRIGKHHILEKVFGGRLGGSTQYMLPGRRGFDRCSYVDVRRANAFDLRRRTVAVYQGSYDTPERIIHRV